MPKEEREPGFRFACEILPLPPQTPVFKRWVLSWRCCIWDVIDFKEVMTSYPEVGQWGQGFEGVLGSSQVFERPIKMQTSHAGSFYCQRKFPTIVSFLPSSSLSVFFLVYGYTEERRMDTPGYRMVSVNICISFGLPVSQRSLLIFPFLLFYF